MAISHVGTINSSILSGTGLSWDLSTLSCETGDLLVVFYNNEQASPGRSLTFGQDASGWTLAANGFVTSRALNGRIYWNTIDGTDITATTAVTATASLTDEHATALVVLRGVDATTPISGVEYNSNGAAAGDPVSVAKSDLSTTDWVVMMGYNAYGTTYTPPSGWTELADTRPGTGSGNISLGVAYITGVTSVGAVTMNGANNDYWGSITLVMAEATPPPSGGLSAEPIAGYSFDAQDGTDDVGTYDVAVSPGTWTASAKHGDYAVTGNPGECDVYYATFPYIPINTATVAAWVYCMGGMDAQVYPFTDINQMSALVTDADVSLGTASAGAPTLGAWNLVTVGYNASGAAWVSLNGGAKQVDTTTFSAPSTLQAWGVYAIDSTTRFDTLAVWDVELTQDDLTWLYNSGAGRQIADLVGGGATTFPQSVAGALTPAASLGRAAGGLRSGALTAVGGLGRQAAKAASGALTAAGALSTLRVLLRTFTGALAASGAAVRRAGKSGAGALTGAGALVRRVQRTVAGTLTAAGVLTALRAVLLLAVGALTPAGAALRRMGRGLAGTVGPTGTRLGRVATVRDGALTAAGALTRARVAFLSLLGSVTPGGALGKSMGVAATGALTGVGAQLKQASRTLAGAWSALGDLLTGVFSPNAVRLSVAVSDAALWRVALTDASAVQCLPSVAGVSQVALSVAGVAQVGLADAPTVKLTMGDTIYDV